MRANPGLGQHSAGSWTTRKQKARRGFVKIRILIDVDAKKYWPSK